MTPKITPVEVQKREFPTSRRGYEPEAVRSFLQSIAEDLEQLLREDASRSARLERLEEENAEHRDRERILKETLLAAQRMAEEIRANARKESELVVRQAEQSAERLTGDALARAAEMEKALKELKLQRANFRVNFRATLEMFQNLLDLDREEDEKIAPLAYLSPPKDASHGS